MFSNASYRSFPGAVEFCLDTFVFSTAAADNHLSAILERRPETDNLYE